MTTQIKNKQEVREFIEDAVNTNILNYCSHIKTIISMNGDNNLIIMELYEEYNHMIDLLISKEELNDLNSSLRAEFYNGLNNDGFSMSLYSKTKELFEKYNDNPKLSFD